MKNKTLLITIFILIAIACGLAVWRLHFPAPGAPSNAGKADSALLAALRADMQGVAPHFIDSQKANGQPLTPHEQKIKHDLVALMSSSQKDDEEFYSQLWLDAVGTRYILASQPIAESSYDEVIDSQTGTVTPIPESARYALSALDRNAVLYIDTQHIYLYTLDQPAPTLVPGSALSGTQTYTSGEADNPSIIPRMSYTPDSITITIFDTSKRVPNPQLGVGATMNGAVREVTLAF